MSKAPTLEEFAKQGGEVNVLAEVCVYDTLMDGRPGVDPETFQLARQIVHDLTECGVCLEHHEPPPEGAEPILCRYCTQMIYPKPTT